MRSAQPEAKPRLRVYVLDDHELIRRGVADLLSTDPDLELVGQAATAEQAISDIPREHPDVALLDLHLSRGSGLDVCRRLRQLSPKTKSVILTASDDPTEALAAIEDGADGYVLKSAAGTQVLDAIHDAGRGRFPLDPDITHAVIQTLQNRPPDESLHLTHRESDVLALVARGLTNREIGRALRLTEKTVKNHVSRILAKLGVRRRTQAAVFWNGTRPRYAGVPKSSVSQSL
jgi:DNA-binding NarL/FixJ family response regulator